MRRTMTRPTPAEIEEAVGRAARYADQAVNDTVPGDAARFARSLLAVVDELRDLKLSAPRGTLKQLEASVAPESIEQRTAERIAAWLDSVTEGYDESCCRELAVNAASDMRTGRWRGPWKGERNAAEFATEPDEALAPHACLEHRPALIDLAKVAGTVEDNLVAEIVDASGDLGCVDSEEESQIVYQLASEVMIHRAAALSAKERQVLLGMRDSILAHRRHLGPTEKARVRVLDRLLGRTEVR